MLSTYPAAWLLLGLPFLSAIGLRSVPWLWRLASAMNPVTWSLGVLGLMCLIAGLLGLLPGSCALPLALAGGAVSGYAFFSLPGKGHGDDGDDWRRHEPPADDPPPPPVPGAGVDWQLFDRLREQWEQCRLMPR